MSERQFFFVFWWFSGGFALTVFHHIYVISRASRLIGRGVCSASVSVLVQAYILTILTKQAVAWAE